MIHKVMSGNRITMCGLIRGKDNTTTRWEHTTCPDCIKLRTSWSRPTKNKHIVISEHQQENLDLEGISCLDVITKRGG